MTHPATLVGLLLQADRTHAAIKLPDEGAVTIYRSLAEQVESLASCFRRSGLQPGDVVGIVLPNSLEYLVIFLAVARARLTAAPLNPAYKPEEFRFYLEDTAARAVIVPPATHAVRAVAGELGIKCWTAVRDTTGRVRLEGEGVAAGQGEVEAPRPDDTALFLHTSGTTSRPKGVPLSHANLTASARNIADHYRLTPEDTSLVVMPLFHVHGLIGATLSTLLTGGTVVVPPRFSAGGFWPAVKADRVTWYSAVPTIHQVLLSRYEQEGCPGSDVPFRFIRSCSAALAPSILGELESRFNAPVLEAYGMTEAAHQMASNPLPPAVHKPGSVGQGTRVEVAIMDEAGNLQPPGTPGEVVIRGPNVTRGYHKNTEANAASFTNGWFRTGDRGVLDADGYLTLIGRIKELINRGGEKISPLEVDAALLSHPAVAEAAAFAAPDAKYGEEVHAAVVLKGEATPQELRAHCGGRLADFKVPKVIHILAEMPRTATGKVQRRHVAAALLKK
jgi:acyl-CoA synthetase (AMP-forming)/AMP-acid ligase II